jgi:hypothetical protein
MERLWVWRATLAVPVQVDAYAPVLGVVLDFLCVLAVETHPA